MLTEWHSPEWETETWDEKERRRVEQRWFLPCYLAEHTAPAADVPREITSSEDDTCTPSK